MIRYPDLIYVYDGTYDGLLSCVFTSFAQKEIPSAIQTEEEPQLSLTPLRRVATHPDQARRVAAALPKKLGAQVTEFFQLAFLTCLPGKELYMLRFMHLAFRYGPSVLDMLADDTVHVLSAAIRHMLNEAHLLKGFIRFSDYHSFLVTVIHPKNFVLPLLQPHFCNRFSRESFLIFDENHSTALFYRPGQPQIMPLSELFLEAPNPEEQKYRALWQTYYETVAIKARYNPICRMSHMPKRYWDYMAEFGLRGLQKYQSPAHTATAAGAADAITLRNPAETMQSLPQRP